MRLEAGQKWIAAGLEEDPTPGQGDRAYNKWNWSMGKGQDIGLVNG